MQSKSKKSTDLYCNRKRNMTMSGMLKNNNKKDSHNKLVRLRYSISKNTSRENSCSLNVLRKKSRISNFNLKLEDGDQHEDDYGRDNYEGVDVRDRRESEFSTINCRVQ